MSIRSALDGRAGITAALVRRLIAAQFPQWKDLPVTPVKFDGHDNRTYRLGNDMSIRLPTAAGYVAAVAKEAAWLPRLAPALPVAIPSVLGVGKPGERYPFPWSVRGWVEGDTAAHGSIGNMSDFAVSVAELIVALQKCETVGAPLAGEHSWYRGASLRHYDHETKRCLVVLADRIDVEAARGVWEAALATEYTGPPVWFHGDVAPGNLLVQEGKLTGVIDFGCCGVGDPACDLVIAWTMLSRRSREAFRQTVGQDSATWARSRGWALWKALLQLENPTSQVHIQMATAEQILHDVLEDHTWR